MNNGLYKAGKIDRGKLSEEFYFESLLEQAQINGLLSGGDIERLQYECLSLLAYKTERYNAGDSSSIAVEKAREIMISNLFTIGLWLKIFPDPDSAADILLKEPVADIYQKGRKRIDTMLSAAKALHAKLLSRLVDTGNVFCRSTVEDGIKGFFKLYYPDFSAHEIHITADYPVYNPLPNLVGIEFIQAYLKSLYYENLFCGYFEPIDIHHLLCGYDMNYREILLNIYEPVLCAAIGCALTGADAHRLDITASGAEYLCRTFDEKPDNEILSALLTAVRELERSFQFPRSLMSYVLKSLPRLAGEIKTLSREKMLSRAFFRPLYPENKPGISFSFGEKMDDGLYREVIESINQCASTQDKLAVIEQHIHSLADLEDILLDAGLSQEEILSVLRSLDNTEIAALAKRYRILSDINSCEYRDQEKLLRKCIYGHISSLSEEKQKLIKNIYNAIIEE